MFRQREFMKRCKVVSLHNFCYVRHTYEYIHLTFNIDFFTDSKEKRAAGRINESCFNVN
jgi:hypothetical protein